MAIIQIVRDLNQSVNPKIKLVFLVVLSLGLYGLELLNVLQLSFDPSRVAALYGLILVLVGVFALGLIIASSAGSIPYAM